MRSPIPALLLLLAACQAPSEHSREWPVYHGDKAGLQYSPLSAFSPASAPRIRLAWTYRSGELQPGDRTQIQCNPLIIEGQLYGTSPKLQVFALDAATGQERWRFDPFAGAEELSPLGSNRGLAYWSEGKERRLFFSANEWLYALDPATGQPIPSFGRGGRISLKEGLDREVGSRFLISNTPGIVYRDLIIMGSRVSENADAAPGHIRAFDVRSGARKWIFHTLPQPGEPGLETWPEDAWQRNGGANSWAGMSLDEARGMVYVPTGSASYDFYGGDRPGQNLYANCILALDAASGKLRWHFQTVHHDLWDRDLPAPPDLVSLMHEGRRREAVAQITKQGFVFLLDRDTGEPLFPVEEQAVPPSDLPGEAAWPTQPVPRKPAPFVRQHFSDAEITNRSPEAAAHVRARLAGIRREQLFTPPSREGTLIFPGFDGGGEWGGAAFDPETGLYYVNANEMPWILTMVETKPQGGQALSYGQQLYRAQCAACHGPEGQGDPAGAYPSLRGLERKYSLASLASLIASGRRAMPSFSHLSETQRMALAEFVLQGEKSDALAVAAEAESPFLPYASTGYNRFLDPEGYPAVRPPWGTLTALDLGRGEIAWQVPLGEVEALTRRGIPKTGTENYGGPVVTAGGLLFIAATKDECIRAFDKRTGEELWKYKLPAGGYATPAVYEAGGKPFVVIACGGGKMGTPSGDAWLAFTVD